jgi:hypothetical protein
MDRDWAESAGMYGCCHHQALLLLQGSQTVEEDVSLRSFMS